MSGSERIDAVVRGRVQGVGFRYTTRRRAQQLGLAGWARNRPNGSVEVCAQGSDDAIERLITFLEKGPPGASITSLAIDELDTDSSLHLFEVRP